MLSRYRNQQPSPGRNLPKRLSSQLRRSRCIAGVIAMAMVLLLCCQPRSVHVETTHPQCRPKILVLRGIFEVFSLGMNDLARKLRCRGYDAEVTSWILALAEVECSDPRPLVVVGHSLGGRMCGWASRKLKSCGRRVPLIIIVDANLFQSIPPNVDECLNLYVTNKIGVFHGSPVKAESSGTEIVNWDVSRGQPSMFAGGVNHFDIDATAWVHQIIIDKIDATFAPPSRAPSTVLEQESLLQQHATLAPTYPDSSALVAPGRTDVPAGTSGASPNMVTFRAPTLDAMTSRAGERVPRQLTREPHAADIVTQESDANLASKPSTGFRVRFASFIGDQPPSRLAERNPNSTRRP
jgi:hypothetical protein